MMVQAAEVKYLRALGAPSSYQISSLGTCTSHDWKTCICTCSKQRKLNHRACMHGCCAEVGAGAGAGPGAGTGAKAKAKSCAR